MTIYKGDFLLSIEDRFCINEMDSSKMKIYNIDKDIYVEGLGEISVRVKVDISKGIRIQVSGFKISNSNVIFIGKEDIHEIISIYTFYIEVGKERAKLLLNVKLDENDFKDKSDYLIETLNILKDKVEYSLIDDLSLYIENLDVNYIINIIYGAFIIHNYSLTYPNSREVEKLEKLFVNRLENIGFLVPKPNSDMLQKVEMIVDMINSFKTVKPESMGFVLINTLPSNPLSKPYRIDNVEVLYNSIFEVIRTCKGIECL